MRSFFIAVAFVATSAVADDLDDAQALGRAIFSKATAFLAPNEQFTTYTHEMGQPAMHAPLEDGKLQIDIGIPVSD